MAGPPTTSTGWPGSPAAAPPPRGPGPGPAHPRPAPPGPGRVPARAAVSAGTSVALRSSARLNSRRSRSARASPLSSSRHQPLAAARRRFPPTFARTRAPRARRAPHRPLEHRGRAPHGVVPVDVAVHLVLGEQQRLERAESLFQHADLEAPRGRSSSSTRRGQQPVHVDLAVRHAAHQRVALQVVDLVEVERAGNQPLERAGALRRVISAPIRSARPAMPIASQHARPARPG